MHYSSFCSTKQERRQLSVQLAFQSSTLQLPLGGTIRNDMVHGTSGPRFHFPAGEQLFARVPAAPETPPYPTLSREGWRGIFFYEKERVFLSSTLYRRQAIVTLLSTALLHSFSCTFVSQGFSIKDYKNYKTLGLQFIFSAVWWIQHLTCQTNDSGCDPSIQLIWIWSTT